MGPEVNTAVACRLIVATVVVLLVGCSTMPDQREERKKQCASDAPMGFWYSGGAGVVLEHSARTDDPMTVGEMLDLLDRDKILGGLSLDPMDQAFIDNTFAVMQSRVKDIDREAVMTRGQKLAAAAAWYDLANSVLEVSDLSESCRDSMKLKRGKE